MIRSLGDLVKKVREKRWEEKKRTRTRTRKRKRKRRTSYFIWGSSTAELCLAQGKTGKREGKDRRKRRWEN